MLVLQVEPNEKEEQLGALVRIEQETFARGPHSVHLVICKRLKCPFAVHKKGNGGIG